ncbi:MAG: hypothetical protein ACYTHM_03670 [Planctomycetota bacterium]|jgi:hypothetical protein
MAEDLVQYIQGLRLLDKFGRISRAIQGGETFRVGGMYGSSPALLLAALRPDVKGTFLVATSGMRVSRSVLDDLLHFFGRDEVALFPPWPAATREGGEEDVEIFSRRLHVLSRYVAGRGPAVVVAPVQALTQEVVPPEAVQKNTRWLRVGEDLDLRTFLPWLEKRDLRRVPMAESNGEWSLRGSILDIFPYSSARPYRIELFDETVDSIREYDPASQVSIQRLETCRITLIQKRRFKKPGAASRAATLLDYLPKGSLCVCLEPDRIAARISEIFQRSQDARIPLAWDRFLEEARRFARLFLTSLPHETEEEGVNFTIRSIHRATPGIEGVLDGFRELIKKKPS